MEEAQLPFFKFALGDKVGEGSTRRGKVPSLQGRQAGHRPNRRKIFPWSVS